MNLPCRTCLTLPICKQLICPNPPRFVSSAKIIKYLLTNNSPKSINCDILKEYCSFQSEVFNYNNPPNNFSNIYDTTSFFSQPYGDPNDETNPM